MKGETRFQRQWSTMRLCAWFVAMAALSAWAVGLAADPPRPDSAQPPDEQAKGLLKALAQDDTVARQAAQHRAKALCQQAQAALGTGQVELAHRLFREATLADPSLTDATVGLQKTSDLLGLKADDQQAKQSEAEAATNQQRAAIAKQIVEQGKAAEKGEKSQSAAQLVERAKAFYKKNDYTLSLQAAEAALKLDPKNADAQYLKEENMRRLNIRDEQELAKQRDDAFQLAMQRADEMAVPQNEVLRGPFASRVKVVQPSSSLSSELSRAAWERKLDAALMTKISCDFRATPLEEVVTYFREAANLNIAIDPRAAIAKTPITLPASETELIHCLNNVCRFAKLRWYKADEMVVVSDRRQPEERVSRVYDISDLTIDPKDFEAHRQALLKVAAPARDGPTFGTPAASNDKPNENTAKLDQTESERIGQSWVEFIRRTIARDTWSTEDDGRGAQGTIAYRNGKLVVNHTPEVQKQIEELLSKFRKARNIQVLVQGRFVEIYKDYLEKIGVDWTGLGSEGGPPSNQTVYDAAGSGTQPAGFASRGAFTLDQFGMVNNPGPQRHQFSRDDIRAALVNPDTTLGAYERPADTAPNTPLGGLTLDLAFLQRYQVRAILQAVVKEHKGTLLSSPRLVCFNGQRANLIVANLIPVVMGITPEGPLDLRMVTDGIVFEVQPFVSADQKYVTLEVLPSIVRFLRVNTVDIVQSQVLTTTGGVPVIVTTINTLRLPETAIRGIQTTVSIPDGGTLLVGGMSDTRETKGYAGVPVVERIPLVKYLFSNWGESNRRHNLVMLIRTDVLIVDEYEPMRGAAMAP